MAGEEQRRPWLFNFMPSAPDIVGLSNEFRDQVYARPPAQTAIDLQAMQLENPRMPFVPQMGAVQPSVADVAPVLGEMVAGQDMYNAYQQGGIDALMPDIPQPVEDAVGVRDEYLKNPYVQAGLATVGGLALMTPMMRRGGGPARFAGRGGRQRGVIGYHGSPHKYDEPSVEHVGKGQGAASYGHGIYYAENKDVAKSYMDELRPMTEVQELEVGGIPVIKKGSYVDYSPHQFTNKPKPSDYARAKLQEDLLIDEWEIRETFDKEGVPGVKKLIVEKIDAEIPYLQEDWPELVPEYEKIKARVLNDQGNVLKFKKGDSYLYKVDIPDEHVENFLDWDKPLSKQPESVRNAIINSLEKFQDPRITKYMVDQDVTGGALYGGIVSQYGEQAGDMAASKMLNSIGIKGIKYLDQGSREAGKGTRNFVVFDDSIIKPISRNGEEIGRQTVTDENWKRVTQADFDKQATLTLLKNPERVTIDKVGAIRDFIDFDGSVQGQVAIQKMLQQLNPDAPVSKIHELTTKVRDMEDFLWADESITEDVLNMADNASDRVALAENIMQDAAVYRDPYKQRFFKSLAADEESLQGIINNMQRGDITEASDIIATKYEDFITQELKAEPENMPATIQRQSGTGFDTVDDFHGNPKLPAPPQGFVYDNPIQKNLGAGNRRLTNIERQNLNALDAPASEKRQIAANAQKYRNTYTPDTGPGAGWQQFEIAFSKDPKTGAVRWAPKRVKGQMGFSFARDPKTGKMLTGHARAKAVNDISNAMVKEISAMSRNPDHNVQEILKARHWYRSFRDAVRREFGGAADIYMDAQAAASPNTELSVNFRTADEFTERYLRGEFDDLIKGAEEHFAKGGTWDNLPRFLLPKKRNGKLYGMHGKRLLQAAMDAFRQDSAGLAPKMRNYGRNLIGLGNDATIDAWAARTLQRLSGHRMPPPMVSEVSGVWTGSGAGPEGFLSKRPPKPVMAGEGNNAFAVYPGMKKEGVPIRISEEFGMGQDVFRQAAEKLKATNPQLFGDLEPDELQAMMWLAEKNLWERNGWTPISKDSVISNMFKDNPRQRYVGGVSVETSEVPTPQMQEQARRQILNDLNSNQGVMATAPDTWGRWGNKNEVSFDFEVVAPKNYDPVKIFDNVLQVADQNGQMDAFVSKVLPRGTKSPNARPGLEIYLDPVNAEALIPRIQAIAEHEGIEGLTFITDKRPGTPIDPKNPSPRSGGVVGVRMQWVPEIDIRFNDELRNKLKKNPAAIYDERQKYKEVMESIAMEVSKLRGVTHTLPLSYDTAVFGRNIAGDMADDYRVSDPTRRLNETLENNVKNAILRLESEKGE